MSIERPLRILRTVRHIRPGQALAQLAFALRGIRPPISSDGPPPALALERVAVAFLPGPPHARLVGEAEVELLNRRVRFEKGIDWSHDAEGPLWSYHLHQFDHLRHADVDAATRSSVLLDWIARHRAGIGWDPHPISLRVLSWLKLLLTPGALSLSAAEHERVRASLADQLETLTANLEYRLQANHLLSNLLAVVFGGYALEGPRASRLRAHTRALCEEIDAQILPDGGHVERSPMYHCLLLESLLDLANLLRSLPRVPNPDPARTSLVEVLEGACARMLGALPVWCHPDGRIALFADSALGIAPEPADLVQYAESLGLAPRMPSKPGLLDRTGYVRLETGAMALIASIAGPMPPHQPGHAHCDALAFELSVLGERVVTDTGVYEYVPGERRDRARATRSHATIEIAGREQAEIWAAHRIGGRPRVEVVQALPGAWIEACCTGWSTRGTRHRRRFHAHDGLVDVLDVIEGRPRPVRIALPLAPGLEPELSHDGNGRSRALVRLSGGRALRIDLPAPANWQVGRAAYFPEFGRSEERACLVGTATELREGRTRFVLVD